MTSPGTDTVTASTTLAWYVIHVFTGQEEKIKSFLLEEVKRLHLEEQITQVLIPKEDVIEMRDGKKKTKTRVFFPGYMLVEMLLNKATEHLITTTPQVINFVGPKNRPQALRKHEVDRILGHVDRAAGAQVVEVPFSIGDTIKVIDGPFRDFTGVVRDINLEKRKVKVMVSIFGRSTPIELDFLQVSTDLTS
jgi:transcription termination/antitermination protein NusG